MLDNLTDEQVYQLNVLDEYLRYVGTEMLEKETNEAKTIAKLKDTSTTPSVIMQMVDHMKFQNDKVMMLEADVHQLQNQVRELVEALNAMIMTQRAGLGDAEGKMYSIKNYHGIF